jgi:5-methylcytosine-specific restriction endonuclease McrA
VPAKGEKMSDETKAKLSAAMSGQKRSPRGPMSAEHKAKISASQVGVLRGPMSAEHKANQQASMTPEVRSKISASLTGKCSPALRAHLARMRDSWLKSPEGQAAARRFSISSGTWFLVGEQLRERDGDLCQLCLDPIDFDLPIRTSMSRSVDHILPQHAGGTDELENLWVAHFGCNARKGYRYVGRSDGTTDVRKL